MSKAWTAIIATVAVISLVGNWLLYSRYSTSRPIVHFNDDVITRKLYMDTMEHEYGKAVLGKLLVSKIVVQEAEKEHLVPAPADIDARLAEIDRRTPQVSA